jgi:hypothetical protein
VKESVLEVERCSPLPWVKSQAQILMINIQMIALSDDPYYPGVCPWMEPVFP